jgi:SP family general alpha glucoside:H+ symporter-like MFS transporter
MLIRIFLFLVVPLGSSDLPRYPPHYILTPFPTTQGTFQTMSVSYAADVMPVHLRQYLTTYVNLCWVIGQIIASGVLRGLVGNDTQWAYRVSSMNAELVSLTGAY